MSLFDAARNKIRGEDAKQRVLDRVYDPQSQATEGTGLFDAARKRILENAQSGTDSPTVQQPKTTNPVTSQLIDIALGGALNPSISTPKTTTKTNIKTSEKSKGIDFKAEQAKAKSSPFEGKLPAASLLETKLQAPIQEALKGKVPLAEVVAQKGGGPANASKIPEATSYKQYDETKRRIAESNPPALIEAYANAMNYITQGNPVGVAVSRAFSGNSGATYRDSTGNKAVDKVTDVINDFVTPFITPTGAPVGQGIVGSSYDTTAQALNSKAGQAVLRGAERIIPGSSNVARVAATEGIAGGLQGVGFGLQQGQDSGSEIARNALWGSAGGAVLAGAGTALGEGLSKVFSKVPKQIETAVKNSPYEGLTREQRIYRQYLDDVPLSQDDMNFMLSDQWNEANLNVKPTEPTFTEIPAEPTANEVPIPKRAETPVETSTPVETPVRQEVAATVETPTRTVETPVKPAETSQTNKPKITKQDYRELETLENNFKQYKEIRLQQVERGRLPKELADKQIKGKALELAADKRKIIQGDSLVPVKGGLTPKELGNKIKYLKSNHKGKEVIVNGVEGKIKGNAFGRVLVEFPDGTAKAFDPDDVIPKVDVDTIIKQQSAPKVETPKVTEVKKTPDVSAPVKKTEPTPKQRGFAQTLEESKKVPEVVARMDSEYTPITNEGTLAEANKKIKADRQKATNDVLNNEVKATAESIATAQRLIQEYTKEGNHAMAATIAEKAAADLTNAGQTVQAASMWNRLSPEGMLVRAQREIAKINETLGAKETPLALAPADAAKITQTGEQLQQANKIRDLSDEVLAMISNKKPGESLTVAEKKLLNEFEAQVNKVNKAAKPFKSTKSESQKIAKIKPENRTRDQVVTYLDDQAEKARQRIAKRRNIGIVAEANNPVIDYAIIGASKIARGIKTFSDFTEDMVKDFGENYRQYADQVFTAATNRFRRENGLPTTTQLEKVIRNASKEFDETSKNALRRMASEIGYYTDENLKRELTQNLQQIMQTYGKSSLGEKVAGLQTAAQLLSVPTFLRNTIGNAGQFGLEKINKIAAVPIDWTLSKFTGQRTIQFLPKNQEKLWKNFASGTNSGWRGVNSMGTLDSYNVKPSVFSEKNPLKYLTKLTGASLQGMDYAAYRAAYGDVMATYAEQVGKAQGLSNKEIKQRMPELLAQLDDNVRALADQAGKYATYQDETMLSAAAQKVKKGLNYPTDAIAKKAVEKGLIPKSWSLEGFGLGDIVLKYAKTPANLVMRGIDYSPLGFIRAIGEFMPLITKGEFNQYNAVRSISRAVTGTVGLTATGYIMADVGLLTGASSMDADKRSIEEQSGQGAYKANLSGIKRWILSGFDPNEAKFKQGDTMIDYAWFQPAAITLGMGVNFKNAQKNKKDGKELSNVELAKQSIIGGLRTVLENPMVTGLSDVVGGVSDLVTRQSTAKLEGIAKGIPSSFVPALAGQARNLTDNKQRVTYDENILNEMLNLVKNRIPGLSKTLPVSHDTLGNERQRIQGGKENTLGQAINSFINPTKITKFDVTPEAKIILDVLNASNDDSILPRVAKKNISFTDPVTKTREQYDLTPAEYSKLQKDIGEQVREKINARSEYLSNPDIPVDRKAKRVKKILDEVGEKVRKDFKKQKGLGK